MERPFELDHMNHVALRVQDLERSISFYTMLCAQLVGEWPLGTAVRVAHQQTLVLQPTDQGPSDRPVLDHICLAIRAASISDVHAYLCANGVEIIRGPTSSRVGETVNVRDPDGNEIEIRMLRLRD